MSRYRTTTALPFAHHSQATSVLRRELHRQIVEDDEGNVADWSTLCVLGPTEFFGPRGVVHFEYVGSVRPRRPAGLPNRRTAQNVH
jgi:hypothetical protein